MILQLYSIYDNKMEIYMPPFPANNARHAMRKCSEIFTQPNSVFLNYPEDFQVWEIGEYDDKTGVIKAFKNIRHLCTAKQIIGKEKIQNEKVALFNNNKQTPNNKPMDRQDSRYNK